MTDNHTCYMCGRPVTPCANCGGTEGRMVETHGAWFHQQPVDCIVQLQSALKKKAHASAAALQAAQQEPAP